MKFYNNTITVDAINTAYVLIDNSLDRQNPNRKSAIIITVQIISNNEELTNVKFRRRVKNLQVFQNTDYCSTMKVKSGTTILDHLMVVEFGTQYVIQSDKNNIIVSCSYGV